MDGSLANQLLGDRRIEPVTTHYAVTQLPEWVYAMHGGQVRYELLQSVLGSSIYIITRNVLGPGNRLWLLAEDFLICQKIAQSITSAIIHRGKPAVITFIQQQLQVQFAGRGIPPRRC